MHAYRLTIKKDAIDKATAISRSFNIAIFIEVYSDVVIGAFVRENDHI